MKLKVIFIILTILITTIPITEGDDNFTIPEIQFSFKVPRIPFNIIFLNELDNMIKERPEATKYDINLKILKNDNIRVTVNATIKFQNVLKDIIENNSPILEIKQIKNDSYKIQDNIIAVNNIFDCTSCKIISVKYFKLSQRDIEIKTNYEINDDKNTVLVYIESENDHFSISNAEINLRYEYILRNSIVKFIPVGENYWHHEFSIDFIPYFYVWTMKINVEFPEKYNLQFQNLKDFQVVNNNTIINTLHYLTPNDTIKSTVSYNEEISLIDSILINWQMNLFWILVGIFLGGGITYVFNFFRKSDNSNSNCVNNKIKNFSYRYKEWLICELNDGKTPETIAKKCNVHASTIYRYMRKFSLKRLD